MARFTNFATLTYTGGTTDSNTVVGELVETLTLGKTAVGELYEQDGRVTYALSLVNTGTAAVTGVTVTDDLGGYAFGGGTVYPLRYREGSARLFVNGTLSAAPTVTAGPPLTMTGITVPAGGSVVIVYEADVTAYAPLGQEAAITNTATVTSPDIAAAVTAQATVNNRTQVELRITKALSPTVVRENGQLTYTFVVENTGSTPATAADSLTLTDTFDPVLRDITVNLNGSPLTQDTGYTYDAATGVFSTAAGQITVPAATFAQNADGTYTVTPGTATLTVTGTV